MVDPKQKQKQNQKTKNKKKRSSPRFITFPTSISKFPPSLLQFPFTIFLLFFSIFHPLSLFSLPLFSRYVSKNFPVRSLWGALCPLPVMPLNPRQKCFIKALHIYTINYVIMRNKHVLISYCLDTTCKDILLRKMQNLIVTQCKLMRLFEGDIKTDILNFTYCSISKEYFDTKMIFISYSYQKL